MQLHIDKKRMVMTLGIFSAGINFLENIIPMPVPWLRVGAGNVGIVMALYMFGIKEAFIVGLIKVFLGSLFSGRFLTLFFIFSLSGTMLACIGMEGAKRIFNPWISVAGVSSIGGVLHNAGQLLVAYLIFGKLSLFLYLLPLLGILGALTGFLVGILSKKIMDILSKRLSSAGF